jgi:hypothetical protein
VPKYVFVLDVVVEEVVDVVAGWWGFGGHGGDGVGGRTGWTVRELGNAVSGLVWTGGRWERCQSLTEWI